MVDFRGIAPIMGRLWSPLAAVTCHWEGKANAQIAVAITAASIVPDRPRVLVQIYKGNFSHGLIQGGKAFALNFLGKDQLYLIRDFGLVSGAKRDKLVDVPYTSGVTGSPILSNCVGVLDCRVINAMDGGDMTCFLADVVDGGTSRDATPITWREARRLIPAEWNEAWGSKIAAEIGRSRMIMDRVDYSAWVSSDFQ